MSVFSKRYGYSEDQGIQYECVGKRLRNRLWNHFFSAEYDADPFNRDDDSLTNIEHLMDGLGLTFNIPRSPTARAANAKKLREYVFDETKWYLIYDLIERYVGLFDKTTQRELCKEFNEVLEDECSGYRFVKGLITPITNKEEIKTIEKATNTKYSAVNTHISKAFAHIYADAPEEKQYDWSIGQVKEILKDETYIGNSIHNKQTNISYKNKKKIRKPKEEWFRIENTHEPIISKDVFYHVQEQIASRRRKQKDGTTKIFSGLIKCADCGWSLAYGENRQNKTPYGHYHCSNYGQGTGKCSMHYIRYDTLYTYVLLRVQYWTKAVREDEEKLLESILKAGDKERAAAMKKHTAELTKAEKRKTEVDRLFAKMYEDRVSERITEYNFNMLSQKYQMEQLELDEKIQKLKAALSESKQSVEDARKWIEIVKQYSEPTELTAELLNNMIDRIVVHEAVKYNNGFREQKIEIYYRFVGKID